MSASSRRDALANEVLLRVARGQTNKEIGWALGYSPNGIYAILAAARERLEARNRAHAASLWIADSLPEPQRAEWTARLVRP